MAKSVAVFAGRNGLDFWDVRVGVLRIPEVLGRLREAQRILDSIDDLPRLDLFCYVASGDEYFQRNIKLKSLAAAIVQIGLYDRFQKLGRRPNYLLGASNSDPAMMVCAGVRTFEELVRESAALDTLRPAAASAAGMSGGAGGTVLSMGAGAPAPLVMGAVAIADRAPERLDEDAPILAGISLVEYQALESQSIEGGGVAWTQVASGFMDFKKIAAKLQEDYEVRHFINIGPANGLLGCGQRPPSNSVSGLDLVVLDSIEMDPMLGWFWRDVRGSTWSVAQ